jgi:hypothetical protein
MGFFSVFGVDQAWEGELHRHLPLVGARSFKAVTPSDTLDLTFGVSRRIYATTAGNINLCAADDNPATETVVIAFAAGEIKDIHARRILATSTTATGIKAVY